jgi:oxygen-independent coproporphyrinogen-3 oxidase
VEAYSAALDAGILPIMSGIELGEDDRLRRRIISRLMCQFELDFDGVEREYGIRFSEYFAQELKELSAMQVDGLLDLDAFSIRVRPAGKLLIRNICMVFDRYLREKPAQRYSKVI